MRSKIKTTYFNIKKVMKLLFPNLISPTKPMSIYESFELGLLDIITIGKSENSLILNENIEKLYEEKLNNFYTYVCRLVTYTKIEKAIIQSEKGLIVLGDRVLYELFDDNVDIKYHYDFIRSFLNPINRVYVENVLVVSTSGTNGYYHFLFDTVPKLLIMKKKWDDYEKIIINKITKSYFNDFLSLFNLKSKTFISDTKNLIMAKNIEAPLHLSQIGNPNHLTINLLRDSFLPLISENDRQGFDFLYITRENAKKRRVLNEDEFLEKLNNIGFKKIELERISLVHQIELFSRAKIIVAPHGAGLSNIVFCSKQTVILELFPSNYLEACYANISNLLDLNYNYLVFNSSSKNNNFMVKTSLLINEIDRIYFSNLN